MTDKVPHEYNNVNLGHALGYCIHCGGTPNENAVIGDVNHCPKAAEKLAKNKGVILTGLPTVEKFISTHKPPSGRVRELLDCLTEESLEVGHRVCKALRFGLEEIQPDQPHTNADRIIQEYADLTAVVDILIDEGVLPRHGLGNLVAAKKVKLEKYLQHPKDNQSG